MSELFNLNQFLSWLLQYVFLNAIPLPMMCGHYRWCIKTWAKLVARLIMLFLYNMINRSHICIISITYHWITYYPYVGAEPHYSDVTMSANVSQITGVSIVYWTVCSGGDQRQHQSSASLAFVKGCHRSTVKSPHKGPATRKMFPFDDVIMLGNGLQSFINKVLSKPMRLETSDTIWCPQGKINYRFFFSCMIKGISHLFP